VIDALAAVPGLVVRGFRGEDDFPAMLRVYTAAHEADGVEEVTTLDDLRRNYANLVNCDPARDIFVAEVTGEVVAYARVFWQELVDGGRSYENFGFVHPAWRRRGIGGALHRLNEDRLREIAAEHPEVDPMPAASPF
jgi:mycothiol synthase